VTQSNQQKKIRVGVQLHPQHTSYRDYADAVKRADEMGVDTIFNWDHFFPLYGEPQGNHFEGWTLLTAMATLTTHAEVGCLVTCNSYRNAALLSDMAKTVDHISNGRLIFGIGAGWFERDYKEYGYDFGTPGSRLKALETTLETAKHRWEVDVPRPLRSIPILIGGGGEKVTLRLTAQHANIWHGFGDPETYQHKTEVLDNWCKEIGRNPAEIERAVGPSNVETATLDKYVAAGASHFVLGMGVPWDFEKVKKLIQYRDERNG
jgi:probable F420-dependent oxidoreductase